MSGQQIISTKKGGFQWQNWDMKSGYKTTQWRSTVTAPLCASCNKSVFPAEELNAAGQKFHKLCLKCVSCNALLNSGNLNEHEKKVYCTSCYRRQFGPRGVGRGLANSLTTTIETPPMSPALNRIENNIDIHRFHRETSTGSSPSRTSSDDDFRQCFYQVQNFAAQPPTLTNHFNPRINSSSLSSSSSFKMFNNSTNVCPRCSKTVYSAEEVKAIGKSFHKRCYTCANCKSSINAGRYSEHEGEIYDNNCYQRLFGPKGISTATISTGRL